MDITSKTGAMLLHILFFFLWGCVQEVLSTTNNTNITWKNETSDENGSELFVKLSPDGVTRQYEAVNKNASFENSDSSAVEKIEPLPQPLPFRMANPTADPLRSFPRGYDATSTTVRHKPIFLTTTHLPNDRDVIVSTSQETNAVSEIAFNDTKKTLIQEEETTQRMAETQNKSEIFDIEIGNSSILTTTLIAEHRNEIENIDSSTAETTTYIKLNEKQTYKTEPNVENATNSNLKFDSLNNKNITEEIVIDEQTTTAFPAEIFPDLPLRVFKQYEKNDFNKGPHSGMDEMTKSEAVLQERTESSNTSPTETVLQVDDATEDSSKETVDEEKETTDDALDDSHQTKKNNSLWSKIQDILKKGQQMKLPEFPGLPSQIISRLASPNSNLGLMGKIQQFIGEKKDMLADMLKNQMSMGSSDSSFLLPGIQQMLVQTTSDGSLLMSNSDSNNDNSEFTTSNSKDDMKNTLSELILTSRLPETSPSSMNSNSMSDLLAHLSSSFWQNASPATESDNSTEKAPVDVTEKTVIRRMDTETDDKNSTNFSTRNSSNDVWTQIQELLDENKKDSLAIVPGIPDGNVEESNTTLPIPAKYLEINKTPFTVNNFESTTFQIPDFSDDNANHDKVKQWQEETENGIFTRIKYTNINRSSIANPEMNTENRQPYSKAIQENSFETMPIFEENMLNNTNENGNLSSAEPSLPDNVTELMAESTVVTKISEFQDFYPAGIVNGTWDDTVLHSEPLVPKDDAPKEVFVRPRITETTSDAVIQARSDDTLVVWPSLYNAFENSDVALNTNVNESRSSSDNETSQLIRPQPLEPDEYNALFGKSFEDTVSGERLPEPKSFDGFISTTFHSMENNSLEMIDSTTSGSKNFSGVWEEQFTPTEKVVTSKPLTFSPEPLTTQAVVKGENGLLSRTNGALKNHRLSPHITRTPVKWMSPLTIMPFPAYSVRCPTNKSCEFTLQNIGNEISNKEDEIQSSSSTIIPIIAEASNIKPIVTPMIDPWSELIGHRLPTFPSMFTPLYPTYFSTTTGRTINKSSSPPGSPVKNYVKLPPRVRPNRPFNSTALHAMYGYHKEKPHVHTSFYNNKNKPLQHPLHGSQHQASLQHPSQGSQHQASSQHPLLGSQQQASPQQPPFTSSIHQEKPQAGLLPIKDPSHQDIYGSHSNSPQHQAVDKISHSTTSYPPIMSTASTVWHPAYVPPYTATRPVTAAFHQTTTPSTLTVNSVRVATTTSVVEDATKSYDASMSSPSVEALTQTTTISSRMTNPPISSTEARSTIAVTVTSSTQTARPIITSETTKSQTQKPKVTTPKLNDVKNVTSRPPQTNRRTTILPPKDSAMAAASETVASNTAALINAASTAAATVHNVIVFKMLLLIAFVAVPIVAAAVPLLVPQGRSWRGRRDKDLVDWAANTATLLALAHFTNDERMHRMLLLHDDDFAEALSEVLTASLVPSGENGEPSPIKANEAELKEMSSILKKVLKDLLIAVRVKGVKRLGLKTSS